MRETEIHFTSEDGSSNLRALLWEPDATEGAASRALGIVQILHGMAEHIERYRAFAAFLTAQGFIVCGHDQIGHGKSIKPTEKWGMLPADGARIMVADAEGLRRLMKERFSCKTTHAQAGAGQNSEPEGAAGATLDSRAAHTGPETLSAHGLPYFLFGHSMGSFVLRTYLAHYAEGLQGAIICGTANQPQILSGVGTFIARLVRLFKGNEHHSKLLYGLSVGAYSSQIENARTPLDWLSTDDAVVDAYIAEPSCGFFFGAGGMVALTSLTGNMTRSSTVSAAPKELPLLFIAGEEDPVGEKGAAVKRAVARFRSTEHKDVSLVLYPGMRHEILNEHGKEQVYQDILCWIKEKMAR